MPQGAASEAAAPLLPPRAAAARAGRLDALRGAAIVWMVGFHFCYDLNLFGLWSPRQFFTQDPFWTLQRSCIVTLFLLCAGLGQGLALHAGVGWPRFWRRWAQVAGCAVLVSVGSALVFPHSWIHFGVLHGVAVMLLLVRWGVPLLAPAQRPALLAVFGVMALLLPQFAAHPLFNPPWLNWTGLVTRLPVTVDYVPVLPWLGVVLWGVALVQLPSVRRWLADPLPGVCRPLAWLGARSLRLYMLHQPLLLGLLWLWVNGRALG